MRLSIAAFCLTFVLTTGATLRANDDDNARHAAGDLLALTSDAKKQIQRATACGVFEIAPVNLPFKDSGDCNHLGWPVATMAGDTIVVMHRRIPGHKAKGAGENVVTLI